MSLSPVIDYWALLSSLNLGPAYRPSSQPWSLQTHGSHIANGVELVPGAPGYQPQLAYNQWVSLLFSAPPLPLPTLSLASSAEGFALTLSVAGTVKMSVSGDLGSFVAGYTLLTAQATVKEGFLTLSANGQTSTATSQYVVLGTAGDDSIDTSAAGNRVDDIFGGAGNDTLKGGAGNDVIVGGAGNDTITGGDGADQLTGGAGADVFIYTTRDESYYAGAGTPLDTIADFATGTDKIRFSLSGSTVDASSFATVGNFVDGKNHSVAYSTVDKALYVSATGTSLNNTTAGAYVVSSANAIAAGDLQFVIAGTGGNDVLKGGVGNDTITGGAGNDTLTGGAGNDTFNVDSGTDSITDLGNGSDVLVVSAGATANATVTASFTATSSTSNSGAANLMLTNGMTADLHLATGSKGYSITASGNASASTIVGSGFADTITGGSGNDVITGGAGADTYVYTLASDSTVNNTASVATGFDTVTVTNLDRFDFGADIAARAVLTQVRASNPVDGNGATLLAYLDDEYQALNPPAGRVVVLFRTADGNQYLVADLDASGTLTVDDSIIKIVGAVTGLSLNGGDVVVTV